MERMIKKFLAVFLAALMLAGTFSGCTQVETPDTTASALEPVQLTWYVRGNGNTEDKAAVEAAVNEYLKDTLNVQLKLVFPEDYGKETRMALALGEDIDICWTGNWGDLDYQTFVARDAFLPLDDLMAEYGQDLLAVTPQYGMDACKVGGVTYAIPNQQGWFTQSALCIREDIANKYGFDADALKSYKDLEPLLAQIKADNPDCYPICIAGSGNIFYRANYELNYAYIAGIVAAGCISIDDDSCQVRNVYELPQVRELWNILWDWNQKGYVRSDSALMTGEDKVSAMVYGQSVMCYDTYLPGSEPAFDANFGHKMLIVPIGVPYSTTNSITATMTAITAACKDPARAMMLLNAVNTDPVLYNLLCFGIEGVHYSEENGYAIPVEGSGYDPSCDWAFGNQFNALLREGQPADTWEVTMEKNSSCLRIPLTGFSFDAGPVANELAALTSVVVTYQPSLSYGSLDPNTYYDEFLDKLYAAGLQTVLDEMQSQIDAWNTAK